MPETTIVILSALNHEYEAVRKRLPAVATRMHSAGTIFEIGQLSDGCRIVLACTGVGNHAAAVTAERAAHEFSPAAIIFVGVAYALQPRLRLGDVVVATHVYAYHGATSEDSGLKARPRTRELSYRARQIADQLELSGTWRRRLPAGPGSGPDAPRVIFGPIAAGEIAEYSATSDVREWLHEHYNDAVAGEMEGAGVAQAGHMNDGLPTIIVRGICDYGDADKPASDSVGWQRRAVANAAAFATALAIALAENPSMSSRSGGAAPPAGGSSGDSPATVIGDNARFGVQGQNITVHGGIHMGGSAPGDGNADLCLPRMNGQTTHRGRARTLLMHLSRVCRRVAELATGVTAIITAVRSVT